MTTKDTNTRLQNREHEEECMSRQLVVIPSLALIVEPLRQFVINALEDNLKRYAPYLKTLHPAENLRKALKKDFKSFNFNEAKMKSMVAVHGSKFRFDAFTYAHFFLPDFNKKYGNSFSEIHDPKFYLDILIHVPNINTGHLVTNAKKLAEFRDITNRNKFLTFTEEATTTFFETLKKLTQQIVTATEADAKIQEIDKWEARKLSFMTENLQKLEDNKVIQDVIEAWKPFRENEEVMSDMNDKIDQLQKCVDQKLEEHDSKLDKHDLMLGDHTSKLSDHDSKLDKQDSSIATLYSLTAEHASKFEELKLNSMIVTNDNSNEQEENIDVTANHHEEAKLSNEKANVDNGKAISKLQTATASTNNQERERGTISIVGCSNVQVGNNCVMNISSEGGLPHSIKTGDGTIGHKHKKICANNIGKQWREFGRHEVVDFTEGQMDNIEVDTQTQYDTIYLLITKWHQKLGSKATVHLLASILEEIDMKSVGEKVLLA